MTGQNQFKKERISEAAAQVTEWSMHSDDFCLNVGTDRLDSVAFYAFSHNSPHLEELKRFVGRKRTVKRCGSVLICLWLQSANEGIGYAAFAKVKRQSQCLPLLTPTVLE